MDACEFKSITGLDTYHGFIHLLKSSTNFRMFNLTDETINLKNVRTYSFNRLDSAPITFATNEVAVVINCISNGYVLLDPILSSYEPSRCESFNVDGDQIAFYNNDGIGQVISDAVGAKLVTGDTGYSNVTIATFRLF